MSSVLTSIYMKRTSVGPTAQKELSNASRSSDRSESPRQSDISREHSARRYASPARDGVRPPARQELRLRDRRRRVGGLRGRAPPPRRYRRDRSLTRGGRIRRRCRQPLEPAAVGGESRLAL